MHDAHGVAIVDYSDHLPTEGGRGALRVVALGDDPVEELAAGAQLHNKIDGVAVLEGADELHDVAVAGEVVHDLHLPPHILHVVAVDELPRGDGLAGVGLTGFSVGAEVGDAELAAAELAPEGVRGPNVLHRAAEDPADARERAGAGDGWWWGGMRRIGWGGVRRIGLDVDVSGGRRIVAVGCGIGGGEAIAVAHFLLGQ